MKKTGSVLLCLLLTFSFCFLFAACGGGETATTAATEAPETTAAATTESPQTTAAPATTGAATTAVSTDAPATTNAPQTASAPATTDDGLYTIVFSVDGKETAIEVPKGETPVLPASVASSWETEENYCRILGWDKEFAPADADTTYTANVGKYGLTTYVVRFNMPNGMVNTTVHEGETPTPPKNYDAPHLTADKVGAFTGWDKDLIAPTAENTAGGEPIVYTPVYAYETRFYTVTFRIGATDYPISVAYNDLPICPVSESEIVKNEASALAFIGWDKEIKRVKEDVVYTAVLENAASLTAAKNGAKGVLTLTYDDGIYETANWVNQKNKQYGLNGSCMIYPAKKDVTNKLQQWNALFADGTLEPQSHGMTHAVLPAEWSSHYADNKGNNTQPTYKYELVDAKARLEELFPGHDVICFASANSTLSTSSFAVDASGNADFSRPLDDGGAQKVAGDTYYAVRQGRYGLQSLNPTPDDEEGGWNNLKIQWFRRMNDISVGKGWIDEAVEDGGWLIILCHNIIGEGASTSGTPDITTENADLFYAYASKYVKKGELWCATFGDATKYIRERQNTTVSERYADGVVYVDMTINRETEDGKYLTESVFNYPLTVEVRVPDEWISAYYFVDGAMKTAKTYVGEDGFRRAMVNVTPGADGAVVTTEVRKLK